MTFLELNLFHEVNEKRWDSKICLLRIFEVVQNQVFVTFKLSVEK